MHVKKLNQAIDNASSKQILCIVLEEGICHIYLISSHTSKLKAKIEKNISKKKGIANNNKNEKQKSKFLEQIFNALDNEFNPAKIGTEIYQSTI